MKKIFLGTLAGLLLANLAFGQEVPKEEIYLGYSFLRVNSAISVPAFTANGGLGSFQYNFTKNLGVAADFGGYHNGNISNVQLDSTAFSYLFGPRIFAHKSDRISPFFEALFGGMHVTRSFALPVGVTPTGPVVSPLVSGGRVKNSQNAFSLATGGGLDIKLNRRIAFRPLQVDYVLTRFQPLFLAGLGTFNRDRNQNNLRYSAGVAFRFGGAPPPVPRASCTGTPGELLPDDPPVSVSVQPVNFNPKHNLNYNWSTSGGQVTGTGSSAKVDVSSLSPGSYTVKSVVTDPKQKQNNVASCTASFTVKQPQPPAVACSANPSSIQAGSGVPVAISVQGSTPDGRRIESRKFSASAGNVKEGQTSVGQQPGEWTSTATLDTSGVQSGPININVGVTDVRGLTGTCTASVDVQPAPPPPPPPATVETPTSKCDFKGGKKPARVDNECKASLDDTAIRLRQDPDAKLVVVGYANSPKEEQTAALRAINVKRYLSGGEGRQKIDPGRIEVRTVEGTGEKVESYLVPAGSSFTMKDTRIITEGQPHQ